MDENKTTKKSVMAIAMIIIMLLGFFAINISNVKAAISGGGGREAFSEDRGDANWDDILSKIYADENVSLWCIQHLTGKLTRYMTASEEFYNAYMAGEESKTYKPLDWTIETANNPLNYEWVKYNQTPEVYKYYRRNENLGLVPAHYSTCYAPHFIAKLKNRNIRYSRYEGDDQLTINAIRNSSTGLPGVGLVINKGQYAKSPAVVLKSTVWQKDGEVLPWETYQDNLYVLSALPRYNANELPLQPEPLTEEIKAKGGFDVKEKQYAIWELEINRENGGKLEDGNNDRGLGDIAKKYKEFYKEIHKTGEDRYEDLVKAYYGDKENDIKEADGIHIIEKETTLTYKDKSDGNKQKTDTFKTYEYQNANVEVDTANKAYIMGPFCLDYTFDDDEKDTYYDSNRQYEIKYNGIERITIFNQKKQDIEELGATFKIAYSYQGGITEEGLLKRVNDYEPYGKFDDGIVLLDGEEISSFKSRTPFYIVVYPNNKMKAEDFTGLYAKIDLEYLESITGTIQKYKGVVYDYYYTDNELGKYNTTYTQTYETYEIVGYDDDDDPEYDWVRHSWSHKCTIPGHAGNDFNHEFELHRGPTGEEAQKMEGYSHDGWRHYKRYSVILSAFIEQPKPPDIEIVKVNEKGTPLFGAEFDITLVINGKDEIHDVNINKTLQFNSRVNNSKVAESDNLLGAIRITGDEIKAAGVSLEYFTGTIDITAIEQLAPAGYVLDKTPKNFYARLERGELKAVVDGNFKEYDEKGVPHLASYRIENHKGGIPKIQLEKVNKLQETGELIPNILVYFEVQVAYTDANGFLVDKASNVIRGVTEDGILQLTREDFLQMGRGTGFDIEGYTGTIVLDIIEIGANGQFVVTPRNRDITLVYKEGVLQDYTQYTDAPVATYHLYANPMAEIYAYINGELKASEVTKHVMDYLNNWIDTQMDKNPELKYRDVLGWLKEYIEEGERDGSINLSSVLREWTTSTMTVESVRDRNNPDNPIVRIVIEDTPGSVELPDIPKRTDEPLLMIIAGTAFLDEHEEKDSSASANGKIDAGEPLLKGIKVTLYEADGTLATLVQRKGESRTNPTITDNNGYYEFRGVDALKKYYVEFEYNGMEYQITESRNVAFNSEEWSKTSKAGSEDRGKIQSQYGEISPNTKAYDYYEIKGLYEEIANYTLNCINKQNRYPSESEQYDYIRGLHGAYDKEINDKITYMENCKVKAYAGYSSQGSKSQTYPHKDVGDRFIINTGSMNYGKNEIEFAKDMIKILYPGQLQIHIGLVQRASADLSLRTDIVDTTVSMNRYDTKYDYYKKLGSYHQYIYEEDYNYSKTPNDQGIAFYTEDNVHFYMTYEITVENATSQTTGVLEIVDYYNKEFSFNPQGYTTTKGNYIPAFTSWVGETAPNPYNTNQNAGYGISVDSASRYGAAKGGTDEYKELYIHVNKTPIASGTSGALHIRVTLELTGNSDNAKEVLLRMLEQKNTNTDKAKSWLIGNYAEINAYWTEGAYLDMDSKPGNFNIAEYENASAKYSEAMVNYLIGNGDKEQASRLVNLWFNRMKEIQEDDAWYVGMTLTNSGNKRILSGNVWEAISNEVKSSLDLQSEYGSRYLTYLQENGLKDIKVELVELLKEKYQDNENGATQIVRGTTTTDENGRYEFKSYIPGDYVVRFVYGGTDSTTVSKLTKNTFEPDADADFLPINGQYYQSTKANPYTNNEKYWYKEKDVAENGVLVDTASSNLLTRYSDAYDDSYSRRTQMLSQIDEKVETQPAVSQTSSDYNYEGVISVESTWHNDPIYAYTSTMELEVEYIRPGLAGNNKNPWYKYEVNNIDFGVTPRAYNDVGITKYVSNIKLYNQDGAKIVDTNFTAEGNIEEREENIGIELIKAIKGMENGVITNQNYPDGQYDIEYEIDNLQNARLILTYKVVVNNDSKHDGEIYDTIKYIYEGDKVVAVIYYNEETKELVQYESDELRASNPTIVYHNKDDAGEYSNNSLAKSETNWETRRNADRLQNYKAITDYKEGNREIITSQIKDIIDFVNKPLEWSQDIYGEKVNQDWEKTDRTAFISARENYKIENGDISYDRNGGLVEAYSDTIRFKPLNNNDNDEHNLYANLKPGESRNTTLTLSYNINTSAAGTDDWEYPNMIEITRLSNSAGKIIDIEGYDIDGTTGKNGIQDKETSKVRHLSDLEYSEGYTGKYTPTISGSRSQTVTINTNTGLTIIQNAIEANLGIVLIGLVIFAVGLVLIKKFVLTPKQN